MVRPAPRPLRPDLLHGPHPEDPARWLVRDPARSADSELSADGWRIAALFDGHSGVRSLAARARDGLGLDVDAAAVERLARSLARLGLLRAPRTRAPRPVPALVPQWRRVPVGPAMRLVTHPEARFACALAGTCCRSGYLVPLAVPEARALRRAALRVLGREDGAVSLHPGAPGAPWTWALGDERGCPFLVDARCCALHGSPEQPGPCRTFPMTFVAADPARLFVSLGHRCVCGALDRGPRLAERPDELAARVAALPSTYLVTEEVALDGSRTASREAAVEALVAASLGASDPFAMLRRAADALVALARVRPVPRARPPLGRLLARIAARVDPLDDPWLHAALAGRAHPSSRAIRRDLRAAGLHDPRADARAEVGRFVRDHLFGLRAFALPALAHGLGLLALAASRVLAGLPRADHPAARERILLWEEALAAPEALARVGPASALGPWLADLAGLPAWIDALEARASRSSA